MGRLWPQRARIVLLAALASFSWATVVATAPTPSGAATPTATWDVGGDFSFNNTVAPLACATSSACLWMQGDTALTTTDGGATWSSTFTGLDKGINQVTCPSAGECIAVGRGTTNQFGTTFGAAFTSADGGHTWTPATLPPGTVNLLSISCIPQKCMAVGNSAGQDSVVTSSDGGATWSALTPPSSGTILGLSSVDCTGATHCVIIGEPNSPNDWLADVTTSDWGTIWLYGTLPSSPSTYQQFNAGDLTCGSSSSCVFAANDGSWFTTDGGTAWVSSSPTPRPIQNASCPSASLCIGITIDPQTSLSVFAISADGGNIWVPGGALPLGASLFDVTCTTTTLCIADGTAASNGATLLVRSSDGGSTWATASMPPGIQGLPAVACPTPARCVAAGNVWGSNPNGSGWSDEMLLSQDGGDTWSPAVTPTPTGEVASISCPTASHCVAVGSNGFYEPSLILSTDDGGMTWTVRTAPAQTYQLVQVSCPTATVCDAVGTGEYGPLLLTSGDGGITWHVTLAPDPATIQWWIGISCPSAQDCYALAGVAPSVQDNGEPTSDLFTTTNGGTSWSSSIIEPDVATTAISCPSTSVCYVLGSQELASGTGSFVTGAVTTDAGSTWSPMGFPQTFWNLTSLTCLSPSTCVAVGGEVETTTDQGATWTVQSFPTALPSGYAETDAVSCPSPTSCLFGVTNSSLGGDLVTGNLGLLEVTTTSLPDGSADNGDYQGQLSALGGTQPYSWAVTAGTLPPGLSLNPSSGVITGVPTAPGTSALTFSVTDALGQTASVQLLLTIVMPTPSSLLLTALPPSVTAGQTITYGGIVSSTQPDPGGSVTFSIGQTTLCTATVQFDADAFCQSAAAPVGNDTVNATYSGDLNDLPSSASITIGVTPPPSPAPSHGYWLVGSDGGIFSFGAAPFYGSTGNISLQRPVVDIVPAVGHAGYWLVGSDGGVFSFGHTGFFGSIPGLGLHPAGSGVPHSLNAPIVGMVPTADGGGYFMVGQDGGVFAFGDAKFEGSCPEIGGCTGKAVAVMPDASGNGYWLVTSTGHVYAFGDATSFGQPGPQFVPVTAAAATSDGQGYWVLFSNGVIAGYGDAASLGGPGGQLGGSDPATAIFTTSDGRGYWVASATGQIYPYGDASNSGSIAGTKLNGPIVAASGF